MKKANQHITDDQWELLAKRIYNETPEPANGKELPLTEGVFSDESEKKQLLKLTQQVDLYFELKKYPEEPAWQKIQSKIHRQSSAQPNKIRRLVASPLLRIAASVLFAALLLVSGYTFFRNSATTAQLVEISAADQVLKSVELPDGTLVSLNTNTKLRYPRKFNRKIREVILEGEAFFDVKPNKNKPFVIHAGKAQIRVVGTSFNVNAYPQAKMVEVIVETGRVQVSNKTTETKLTNELILTPGDKGTLVCSSNSLLKTTNQDPNFLAWKTHNLIFKATSLAEVIENLEKVYKVNIRLADPKLNELLLTARFNNYSLDFILKVIETTFKIDAQKVNGQYILKARS